MSANWNTWNPYGMNRVVDAKSKLQITFACYNEKDKKICDRYGFNIGQPIKNPKVFMHHIDLDMGLVTKIYPRDRKLGYAALELEVQDGKVILEYCVHDERLIFKIIPSQIQSDTKLLTYIDFWYGDLFSIQQKENGFLIYKDEKHYVQLSNYLDYSQSFEKFAEKKVQDSSEQINRQLSQVLLFEICADKPTYIICQNDGFESDKMDEDAIESILTHEKNKVKNNRLKIQINGFDNIGDALIDPIYWNRLWDNKNDKVYIPVNREWTQMIFKAVGVNNDFLDKPMIFTWDAAFTALIASQYSSDISKQLIKDILSYQHENGKVPQLNLGDSIENVNPISNPPVVAYCAWKIYLKTQDKEFLNDVYPGLKKWYEWMGIERDRNQDGLLEWGSDGQKYRLEESKYAAYNESGLDDSPMWDEAEWDEEKMCFAMNCVGLSSLHAISAHVLSLMARELGIIEEKEKYKSEYNKYSENIRKVLWDEDRKVFSNRHWSGVFTRELSPTSFYPLIANAASTEMAKKTIEQVLMNKRMFWGDYIFPSISKESQYYDPDGDYWRGRVWPPMNYLVYLGVKNYDNRLSYEIANKMASMFMNEWNSSCHVHENFSGKTGHGEPEKGVYARSCPFYTWGSLMLLPIVHEYIDLSDEKELILGNLYADGSFYIENYVIGSHYYDLYYTKDKFSVYKNKKLFIETDGCTKVVMSIEIPTSFKIYSQNNMIKLTIGHLEVRRDYLVESEGNVKKYRSDGEGQIKIILHMYEASVNVNLLFSNQKIK